MPRGPALTDIEKGQIEVLKKASWSISKIAKEIKRSGKVVSNYLKDPEAYGTKRRSGRPTILTPQSKRALIREASKGQSSARELQQQLQLDVGVRRVRQILQECETLSYSKRIATPVLTKLHKENRVKWAEEHVTWDEQKWANVIFSDEKKFNLDGPDGLQYYWHDLRQEKQMFSKRQSGGGSVMIWGAFSAEGKSKLAILEGNQNSEKYIQTLSEYLLPFANLKYGVDFIFQQDGASIHTSGATKAWLKAMNVDVMSWPSKSPDLNPIENLWGILARKVYANGRQFQTRSDLISCIFQSWNEIEVELIKKLVTSMQQRCLAVLKLNGSKTKY